MNFLTKKKKFKIGTLLSLLLFNLTGMFSFVSTETQEESPIKITVFQDNLVNFYSPSNITLKVENMGPSRIICNISLSSRGIILLDGGFVNVEIDPFNNASLSFKTKASQDILSKDYNEEENLQINVSYLCENVSELYSLVQNETIKVIKASIELESTNRFSLNLNITNFELNKPIELYKIHVYPLNGRLNISKRAFLLLQENKTLIEANNLGFWNLTINPVFIPPQNVALFEITIENFTWQSDEININIFGGCEEKHFNISRSYEFRVEKTNLRYRHTLPYIIFIDEDTANIQLYSNTFYYETHIGKTRALILIQDLLMPSYRYITIGSIRLLRKNNEIICQKSEEFIGPILGGLGLLPFFIIAILGFKKVITATRRASKKGFYPDHIDVG
ncbi:MAG: hypothetical protein QXX99_07600 [Candidatus Bathyarchaeia archaeon]